jgi:hypothetical protein
MDLQKTLHTIFLKSPPNLFDAFIDECKKFYELPAHSLVEIKQRENKKLRGDIFEEFCVLYLRHVKHYVNVWRLEDVPDEILEKLSLKRRDMGIDLIAEYNGVYSAVQCKYKKPLEYKKTNITWKVLSTFYSLCLRSGPWNKYIVMTNCDYVRHVGDKTEKDLSICIGSFRKITKEEWSRMCELSGQTISSDASMPAPAPAPASIDKEALRLKRLAYFQK